MSRSDNHRARIKWKHIPSGRTGVYEDKPGEGTLYLSEITEDWNDFLWTEGNFACDCNRRMLFIDEDRDGCSDDEFVVEIEDIGP